MDLADRILHQGHAPRCQYFQNEGNFQCSRGYKFVNSLCIVVVEGARVIRVIVDGKFSLAKLQHLKTSSTSPRSPASPSNTSLALNTCGRCSACSTPSRGPEMIRLISMQHAENIPPVEHQGFDLRGAGLPSFTGSLRFVSSSFWDLRLSLLAASFNNQACL